MGRTSTIMSWAAAGRRGKQVCSLADFVIATEPEAAELLTSLDPHGGEGTPHVGQLPVC
ncbi:hypothetical protein [Streptomyces sp. V1I1]|uniref:hypothetical protein n=1 Tax=Streptomyces sp. V1I1 TaxID=3042272 RepID=UPI0027851BB1|nr:hypothetical protein [Streptomyces sp. V1I1]